MKQKKKIEEKFMREIGRIKSPELFLGIVRILKVQFFEKDGEPRPFEDLFADVMANYAAAPPKRKRELLGILRDANSIKGDLEDGNTTTDSKANA